MPTMCIRIAQGEETSELGERFRSTEGTELINTVLRVCNEDHQEFFKNRGGPVRRSEVILAIGLVAAANELGDLDCKIADVVDGHKDFEYGSDEDYTPTPSEVINTILTTRPATRCIGNVSLPGQTQLMGTSVSRRVS